MKKISRYIYLSEAVCKCGCGQYSLMPPIVYLFDEAREELGRPIRINSAFRCTTYQRYLRKIGLKAAIISPHPKGFALDLSIPSNLTIQDLIELFANTAQKLGYLRPRFGHKAYNDEFLHVDTVFYGFKPHTSIENPKPERWQPGTEW